ncbi:MAG: ABC transporter permease, partial [Candidatus Thorarchaeota archaeon]
NNDDINAFLPRFNLWGNVNASIDYTSQQLTNEIFSVFISGINFSEEQKFNFGNFIVPNSNQILELTNLSLYHCAIYYEFNKDIKYAENDTIEIRMGLRHGDDYYYRIQNFTIDKIFDYQLKWPISFRNRPLIVVDITSLYTIFGIETFEGTANELILTLKGNEIYYDARDIEGSENKVKDIAGEIQILIGINEFYIDLPKLEVLGFSEFLSVGITIIFVFVSMISMIISGVLINGILKTSVEERIREFGIFRTLGATKRYNLFIVLVQGLLLCGFGTIVGIIVAYLSTQFIILPIAEVVVASSIPGLVGNISFSVTLWSVLISIIIGLTVGLVVSISPAIKVMKLQLIESIHPYRKEDLLYKLEKKASVNYKLIILGIILAVNGGFVLLIIPRIINSGSTSLIAGTLIALLIIFLIGTSLAGLGIMPLIIRFFILIFRFFSRKLAPVYRIFIFRYARRNFSTIVIFAFTFSFVIFTASAFKFLSDQGVISSNLRYGADIVIETEGWDDPEDEGGFGGGFFGGGFQSLSSIQIQQNGFSVNPERILTTDFKTTLLSIEGVERISTVIASPFHLTQIYSEEGKEFIAEIGDYAGLTTVEVSLIGIDEEYSSTIKTQYIEFTQGNLATSFDKLFTEGEMFSCIVSESISSNLNLLMGDIIRMRIQRGDESEIYTFKIVGVAASMPGFFSEFGRSGSSSFMGGVMISQETYINIMDIPPIPYLDKIFIKLSPNALSNSQNIVLELEEENRRDFDFDITDLLRSAGQEQSYFTILDTFFSITLDATIIICLFGLISSSYSTIIERKKEIGIIRTLGLKGKEINRLFTIESLIIMLSSGSVGVIVGWGTGLLLSTSVNLLSDLPNIPTFPLSNMIIVFLVSIIFTLIGMRLLLRKSRKKKIVEIYRETM